RARAPAGCSGRRPPALTGTRRSSALLRAEAIRTRSRLLRPGRPRFGWSGFPFGGGECAEEQPEGAARGIAPSLPSAHGCAVGKPRSALAQSRAHDARATAGARVPFSLVTFS